MRVGEKINMGGVYVVVVAVNAFGEPLEGRLATAADRDYDPAVWPTKR